jgi:hypothetical protein
MVVAVVLLVVVVMAVLITRVQQIRANTGTRVADRGVPSDAPCPRPVHAAPSCWDNGVGGGPCGWLTGELEAPGCAGTVRVCCGVTRGGGCARIPAPAPAPQPQQTQCTDIGCLPLIWKAWLLRARGMGRAGAGRGRGSKVTSSLVGGCASFPFLHARASLARRCTLNAPPPPIHLHLTVSSSSVNRPPRDDSSRRASSRSSQASVASSRSNRTRTSRWVCGRGGGVATSAACLPVCACVCECACACVCVCARVCVLPV